MIRLSYDIDLKNPMDHSSYEEFAASWGLITAPKTSFVSFGGKNPCSLQFDTPSLDQRIEGVLGTYKDRRITVYEEDPSLHTLIHEYAHHLQALNYADANEGWYEWYGMAGNKKQDKLFLRYAQELPRDAYARTLPSEMAAEAFAFCHGCSPEYRLPKGFLKDWFLFFFEEEHFKYTFDRPPTLYQS